MLKLINHKFLNLCLVATVSVFSFVTIVTASPANLTEKMNNEELQIIAVTQAAAAPQPAAASETAATDAAAAAAVPAAAPATSTPAAPAKQQPSRSSTTTTSAAQAKSTAASANTSQATAAKSAQPTKASSVIATAKQYIGVSYVYGGTTPSGFDCSGFVQYVFSKNGITLPRVSRDQYQTGKSVSFSNLQPGDLVFFSLAKNGVVDHVGIYVGNNQFINASSSKGVTIYTLGSYWQSAFLGAKRVI